MPSIKNTARKLKSQPNKLTDREIRRIAEKLAVALEYDAEDISLLLMLFDQIEQADATGGDIFNIVFTVKKHLFVGTNAADDARDAFQADAYRNRGKLLLWPFEQKEGA